MAELFALCVIDREQLEEACSSRKEFNEALRYAKRYGDQYDAWVAEQERNHETACFAF